MRLRRWLLILCATLCFFLAAFVAWVVFFPGPVLRFAASVIERTSGVNVEIGQADGRLTRTVSLRDVVIRFDRGELRVGKLDADIGWKNIFRDQSSHVLHLTGGQLVLRSTTTRVPVQGTVVFDANLENEEWRLNAHTKDFPPVAAMPAPPPFLDLLTGTVTAQGTGLSPKNMVADAEATILSRGGPSLQTDLDVKPGGIFDAVVELRNLAVSSQTIRGVRLTGQGTLEQHKFHLTGSASGYQLAGHGTGSLEGSTWTGTWSTVTAHAMYDWKTGQPMITRLGPGLVDVKGLRLVSGPRRIHADVHLEEGKFEIFDIATDGLNLDLLTELKLVSMPLKGRVSAGAQLTGPPSRLTGHFRVAASSVSVSGQTMGRMEGRGRLEEERVIVDQLHARTPGGEAVVSATVPIRLQGGRVPPMEIRLVTRQFDPSALLKTMGGVQLSSANLSSDLSIRASRGEFQADGWLIFTATGARVPAAGVALKDVRLDVDADGRVLRVRQGIAAGENGGAVNLKGDLSAEGVRMALITDRLELDIPDRGATATVKSDLVIGGSWDRPAVTGRIEIVKAVIRPPEKKKKEKQEVKEEKPNGGNPGPLSMEVKVSFDRDVWFRDGQSAIEFAGNLQIKKEPGGPQRIFGTVRTIRGDYVFYGRSFRINEGVVTFLGSEPIDPTLQIQALYVSDQTRFRVILNVTGTLRQPKLQLTSEPPMEETDIISVLVTGAPMGESGGDVQAEERARLLAANYLAEKVRQRLQLGLDIDVLRFQMAEAGQTALTVGENVTEDLYVSYGQTLAPGGERRVEAEYTLTEHWGLQGYTTNVGRYVIDLLFRFGFR